jgi:hypothetical protein
MKRAAYIALILLAGCLVAHPLAAYVLQTGLAADGVTLVNLKWDPSAFPLPWQLNPTEGTNVSGSQSLAAVAQASFQSWLGVSTAKISFAQGANTASTVGPGYDGINVVTTNVSSSAWTALGAGTTVLAFTETFWFNVGGAGIVDNLGRAINFPGQIMEADIVFNPGFTYSTNTTVPSSSVDFQSVLTHEIGHFLGLDHTNLLSSTMFWTTTSGVSYPRTLSTDEGAGISALYPTASFSSTGTMTGTVRLTSSQAAVFGALVTVVNSNGQPVASTITNSNGQYTIMGLASGSYSVYASPLVGPMTESNVYSLGRTGPGAGVAVINTNFTTRFR